MDLERKHKSDSKHRGRHKSHKKARRDNRSSSSERGYSGRFRDKERSGSKSYDRDNNRDNSNRNSDKPSSSSLQIYRDRAKERRDGVSKDFVLDPEDLNLYNPVQQEGAEDIDEDEQRKRFIEESKYLGGDLEHTHLVKGLDYALLQKVKSDQSKVEKKEFKLKDLNSDSDDAEDSIGVESTRFIHCRTALARRILSIHEEKWPEKSVLFLPGRMVYIMNLDDDQPVTAIIKSKVDG